MADSDVPVSKANNGTDFLPDTNNVWSRWRNLSRMYFGFMSPDGQKKYWQDREARYENDDCRACENRRDYLLKYSPIIRFMNENIQRLGGELDSRNIRCRRCDTQMEGGFEASHGIMLCANKIKTQNKMEDVMAHEMVHAYDHLRFKVDWSAEKDLRGVACTEIRASNLSGECRFANQFLRDNIYKFTNQHQECVRRRAILSVSNREFCKDEEQATKVVNEVWDSCFPDTRPFDEIFR